MAWDFKIRHLNSHSDIWVSSLISKTRCTTTTSSSYRSFAASSQEEELITRKFCLARLVKSGFTYISQNICYIFNKSGRDEKCPYNHIQELKKKLEKQLYMYSDETFLSENLLRKCYLTRFSRVQLNFQVISDSNTSLLSCFMKKCYTNLTFKYKYNHFKIGLQALIL